MFPRDDPGDAVVHRALTIANDQGRTCRPIDLLAALAEVNGPIGEVLRAPDGGPLFPDAAAKPGVRGGGNSYLAAEVMSAAGRLAEERGELLGPSHLLVAVVDQGLGGHRSAPEREHRACQGALPGAASSRRTHRATATDYASNHSGRDLGSTTP